GDLISYDKIINTGGVNPFYANDSYLYEAITENNSDDIMTQPPYNPLSATEIALIKKWIDQGALNNSCQACDTSQASFSNDILPIITGYCTGCHGDNSPSAGIALTNHSNIADNASSGQLSDVINHNAGVVAMPYLAEKLDPCYIAKIDKWIAEGMQNN
ncbi:MAG: hypothetical protein R3279_08275, partial [Putridiphycobacter sp.]|nr:hypothetical protein [Putridiphycobacter sp.]